MALRFDFSFYSVMFEDKKKYDVRFIHIPYTHKNKSRALCVKKNPFFYGGVIIARTQIICAAIFVYY